MRSAPVTWAQRRNGHFPSTARNCCNWGGEARTIARVGADGDMAEASPCGGMRASGHVVGRFGPWNLRPRHFAGRVDKPTGGVVEVALSEEKRIYACDPRLAETRGEWECRHVNSGSLSCWYM